MRANFISRMKRHAIEDKERWLDWVENIPAIQFPPNWLVRVIPPFGGAMVRFIVGVPANEDVRVSVYLDVFGILGYYEGPYWEVYPFDDDVARCGINDTGGLVENITRSIEQQLEGDDNE